MPERRAAPVPDKATTYRGLNDMAEWWAWSEEAERQSLPSYAALIRAGDLVFDIGANRGRKTWIFRQLGARVVAVEPLLAFDNEFVPEFTWRWGGDSDVIPVARAVTAEPEVTLSINRFMPYVSSVDRAWMTESSHSPKRGEPYYHPDAMIQRQVPGITLDELVRQYGLPQFVKVDVEGAENTALATLSVPVPALNMEFHQDWIPVAALEHMDALGRYEWNYCLNNLGQFIMPNWVDRGALLDYMQAHLTESGDGAWGDIYGRLVD